jgi:putative tryptophan/tyrosine transport system substrate-binding protein
MRRREFISLLGAGALASPARAQSRAPQRIGVLWPGSSAPPSPRMEGLQSGLRDAGLVPGRDVEIEIRYAATGLEALREHARELVSLDVRVIAAFGDLAPRAAQQTTASIPITAIADDVLGAGLVASLARPGGNTTGITLLSPELSAKRLAILKEMLPGMAEASLLWDPTTGRSQVRTTEEAARLLDVKLRTLEVTGPESLAQALQAAKQARSDAIVVGSSPTLAALYRTAIDFARASHLPAIYQWKEHALAGGLASYGPGLSEMWRETGLLLAKLLRGDSPAELPVQQPTKFELVLNLATAKAIGLTLPQTLLIRADELIE